MERIANILGEVKRNVVIVLWMCASACNGGGGIQNAPENRTRPAPLKDAKSPRAAVAKKRAASSPTLPGNTDKPRLLVFTRENCLPCVIMKPWVAAIEKERKGTVEVVEINLDRSENQAVGRMHRIRSVPTQVYVAQNGDEAYLHEGIATLKEMNAVLCRLHWVACELPNPSN